MRLGIGSGRAAQGAIARLKERVLTEDLQLLAAGASRRTQRLLRAAGIPQLPEDDPGELDLGIDGADYLTADLDLIKGGGGALLREKLVALVARRYVIVAETAKLRPSLVGLPVPIEVAAFAAQATARRVARLGYSLCLRRRRDGEPFLSDNGNLIYDCSPVGPLRAPDEAERLLRAESGVIETGFFLGMADLAFIATEDGVRRIEAIRR